MRSRRVFCNGLLPVGQQDNDLVLNVNTPKGQFGHVSLGLERLTSTLLADLPPRLADLLEIASYVYCADQFTKRDRLTMPKMGADWRRGFEFHIGVRDPGFWNAPSLLEQLSDTLDFLSDDRFSFRFHPIGPGTQRQSFMEFSFVGASSGFVPDQVLMFSGGLDSFAGAAEALLKHRQRVALVSHQSSTMVTGYQNRLVQELQSRSGKDRLIHVRVNLTTGFHTAEEFTQRTRSFLFAALGFLVADIVGKRSVSFYENGVVSMNLPLAEHVLGSRATRTTHPRVLHDLGALFSRIAACDFKVVNPFFWDTKADIVRRIAEVGCASLIPETFSCANVRKANQVDRHCGVCSQCLDRRFGVLAADCGQYEPTSEYDVELFRGERKPGLDAMMAGSYVLAAHRHATSTEPAFLHEHGEVLRALPYLSPLSVTDAATSLHQLHRRHGQAVKAVVANEAVTDDPLTARLALPENTLLGMVMGSLSADIACVDQVELAPPAAVLATERGIKVVTRPISFAADQAKSFVVFTEGGKLTGASAKLFLALLPNYQAGQQASAGTDGFAFTKAKFLADQLGVSDQTVRQQIRRARAQLKQLFATKSDVTVEDDDIIETNEWSGYRLNPRLARTEVLDVNGPAQEAAE